MKKTCLLAGGVLLICLWSTVTMAALTTQPALLTIARGTPSARVLNYSFDVNATVTPTFNSTEGVFISGATVLGRVPTPISITLRPKPNVPLQWIGTTSEQLVVPETVVRRAEKLGLSRFQYQRQFLFPAPAAPILEIATVQIAVTTSGGGQLQLNSLRLYFENGLGNITIKRNNTSLVTYADIHYNGTGFLRAYWQVDGRVLSYVNQYLSSGSRITLQTPAIPGLPTFREGSHTVRLIIQQPDQGIPFPKAIYYVKTDQSPLLVPINLVEPGRQAVEKYAPFRIAWNPASDVTTYLIEFFLQEEDRPVFSAYVAGHSEYVLPEPALRHYFVPGKTYNWQVKGFNKENNLIGESDRREFRLR